MYYTCLNLHGVAVTAFEKGLAAMIPGVIPKYEQ